MRNIGNYRLLLANAFLLAACGQDPAFVTKEETQQRGSLDATAVDEQGNPIQRSTSAQTVDDLAGDISGVERISDWTEEDRKRANEIAGGIEDPAFSGNVDGVGSSGGAGSGAGGGSGAGFQLVEFDQSFIADSSSEKAMTANLPNSLLTQNHTMAIDRRQKSISVIEPSRTSQSQWKVQGKSGTSFSENQTQVGRRPLDILVVIDNSGSMEEEQTNLSTKMNKLLDSVRDADWKIGVVTTDPTDGCLRELISKGDPNAALKFERAITVGVRGSGNERGIYQSVRALKDACGTNKWVRDESTIAVLIVSDEDNCSDGTDCGNADYSKGTYLTDYLKTIRTVGVGARVYGIIDPPGQSCPTGYNKSNIYAEVVQSTGGQIGSICAADYSATLSAISADIAVILNRTLTLSSVPDAGSLEVTVNGVVSTDWTLNGKVITFTTSPAENSVIRARYVSGATPKFGSISLNKVPYQGMMQVFFNGVEQSTGLYGYDAANNAVVFGTPPPDSALVRVNYLEDVQMVTQFALGTQVDPASVVLSVDGRANANYNFDPATGALGLGFAPAEASRIDIRYEWVGGPITRVPLTVGGAAPQGLTVTDETGANVPFVYLGGAVQFADTEFVEGRMVKFEYRNPARDKMEVELPSVPSAGSLSVSSQLGECDPSKLVITGRVLSMAACGFGSDIKTADIKFRSIDWRKDEFEYDNAVLNGSVPASWKVYVNGKETARYAKNGMKFKVSEAMPEGSIVRVRALVEKRVETAE